MMDSNSLKSTVANPYDEMCLDSIKLFSVKELRETVPFIFFKLNDIELKIH